MVPNLIEYERPTSVTAALRLLARNRIRTVPLAGGTALIPSHDASIESVVDLSALNLGGIERHAEQTSIGAMTTVQSVAVQCGYRKSSSRTSAHT
jgi:CO/xanthine dehydrogenase FAD-binding subunit